MRHQHLGVFVVVTDKKRSRVLLGKRKNGYKSGFFGFPGGRLHVDESLIACGKRELAEETGLAARKLSYLCVIRELQKDYNFIHFAYLCQDYQGVPEVLEKRKCGSWDWYALRDIPKKILPVHKLAVRLLSHPRAPRIYDIL